MLLINVRDNENNKWKRKTKRTKTVRSKGVLQAIGKVWKLNGFAARSS